MKQKLRIVIVILIALSIAFIAFFSLYDVAKIPIWGKSTAPLYRLELIRKTDWALLAVGGSTTFIIGGLFLYLLREPEKRG